MSDRDVAIPPLPRFALRPHARCFRTRPVRQTIPDGLNRYGQSTYTREVHAGCTGWMTPVRSESGAVLALRCGRCGYVSPGDGHLAKEVRR